MRLSEDKISHLSHLLIDTIKREQLAEMQDEVAALKTAKEILTYFCHIEDEVDTVVRKKLASYSKRMMEGDREWEVLYRKHFDEEMKKRWHSPKG